MDELAIKNEVLEAETIIRGLAQRMQESGAALQAAEAARQNLTDARLELQGSSARLDSLHTMASEALNRIEQATKGLEAQASHALEAATGQVADNVRSMQDVRSEVVAAAQAAQQAAKSVLDRDTTALANLQRATSSLPERISQTTGSVLQSLMQQVKQSSDSGELLFARMESSLAAVTEGLRRNEEASLRLQDALQKQSAFYKETSAHLLAQLQKAHDDDASRLSDMEEALLDRLKSNGRRTAWSIFLQILLLLAAAGAGYLVAKPIFHI